MNPTTSKTQLNVLRLLIKTDEELSGYEITKRLYSNSNLKEIGNRSNFIYKILNILVKKKIIIKKLGYPSFYKLISSLKKEIKTDMKMLEVKCPSCGGLLWVREFQTTKQCHCLKLNGKPRRFWVNKNRLTGRGKIV